ncbi:uncharacterized protein LOC105845150 isoform X1 [Hydra vulgaris]|uniref:uncharacterized protein LOC105845150 isoform X1 n=1 Tax=Hydra vulgaris TaxID=6087 RepID=UPI001F5E8A06|nr:uncharacterized protein LOC105845150 isoform X1 [Hydra vulgaris]
MNTNRDIVRSITDNPAAHYEAFLRYLQSTQPTTATSSSAISALVPSSIALRIPSTSGIIVTSSAATSVPQPPQQTTQPSAELTYGAYRRYRDQHPGPMSNRSFLRWVRLGGNDGESFSWAYHPPNRGAGSSSRRGNRGGGRGRRRNGGGLVVNGGIHYY